MKLPDNPQPAAANAGHSFWQDDLRAVRERLRRAADSAGDATSAAATPAATTAALARLRATALDCVAALGLLQGALAQELLQQVHLAQHDALTALPNRAHFRQRLDDALAPSGTAQPALALLFVDLDGLKSVNDTHGHGAGDELLRIVAARLRGAVRARDLVGRIGGDEFGCLLTGLSGQQQLERIAHKLGAAVAAPLTIGRVRLSVRASIGIALHPADASHSQDLLDKADAAMHHAKRAGSGHAFYSAGIASGTAVSRAAAGSAM